MPWIHDTEGSLVNLDHVTKIDMQLSDESKSEFAIFAHRDLQRAHDYEVLFVGDEGQCAQFLKHIAGRMDAMHRSALITVEPPL